MGRRNDHTREELKEISVQAATNIINDVGLDGFSARKVATAIGYTVGSLYLVFKNLDDLLLQVNERTLDALFEKAEGALKRQVDPRARLFALGDIYIDFAIKHRNRWLAIFEHRLAPDEQPPPHYQERISKMFALVEVELKQLAPVCSENEVHLAAQALWSGVHGVCILHFSGKLDTLGNRSVKEIAHALVNYYLQGFEKSAG